MADEKSGKQRPVSIVVLNYNGKKFVEKCLSAVLDSNYKDFEVIFVDNGSTDGSFDFVNSRFRGHNRLKLIRLNRNYGFEEGNNIGVKHASAYSEYLAFLNADTEVDPNWLNALIVAMESNPAVGVAQSLILDYFKRDIVQCAGIYLIDFCSWTWALFQGLHYKLLAKRYEKPLTIFAALGAAMIIRRSVFNEVKFDTKFFFYFDEIDLAWRVWLRGYQVICVPSSKVYHALGSGEFSRRSKTLFAEFHLNKNALRMMIKNYCLKHVISYLPTTILLMLMRAIYYAAKGEATPFMGLTKGILWNIMNFQDTLSHRLYIQKIFRRIRDDDLRHVMKRLPLLEIIRRMK